MCQISPKSINISIVGKELIRKKSADQVQKEQAHIAPSIEHRKHWSMFRDVHMCRLSAYIPQSIIDRKKMC